MRQLSFFILFLFTLSCDPQESNFYSLDPRSWKENNIKLSGLSNDIRYIPLDNKYPYVARMPLIYGNSMFFNIKDTGIVQFNRQGKMLLNIGRNGRGPGEYIYGMNFDVNEKSGTIYVLDGKQIKIYSKSGKFIGNLSLDGFEERFDEVYFFNSHLFIAKTISGFGTKFNWIILDTTGHLIRKKENTVKSITANTGGVLNVYKFQNNIYYSNWYDDSVYCISSNLDYKVAFVYNVGEKRLPLTSLSSDPSTYMKQMGQYVIHSNLFETNRFLILDYRNDKNSIALIDKKTKKTYLNYHIQNGNNPMKSGIANDVDCGLMFMLDDLSYFTENSTEYLIGLIDPYELKAHVGSTEFKNLVPKYPEKKNALVKFAAGINETDNPILMMIKLK